MTHPSLRSLVFTWDAAQKELAVCWEQTRSTIVSLLTAVGGYATTTPNARGNCHDFTVQDNAWADGAVKVGETYGGGRTAPSHPDVGDRCRELAMALRVKQMAAAEARMAVGAMVRVVAGDVGPEHVALALVLDSEPIVSAAKEALTLADRELEQITGWSGSAGNWPLHEAHTKVRAALKTLDSGDTHDTSTQRSRIITWLRSGDGGVTVDPIGGDDHVARTIADAIERGDHLGGR